MDTRTGSGPRGAYHRDMRQSVKKKDRYALAQHLHEISRYSSSRARRQRRYPYPEDGQKLLRDPKPPLDAPRRPPAIDTAPLEEQLPHECEPTAEAPPCGGRGAQGAAEEKREVPAPLNAEEHGNAGVQHRGLAIGRDGGRAGWRGRIRVGGRQRTRRRGAGGGAAAALKGTA
jgi:hypothetical protein